MRWQGGGGIAGISASLTVRTDHTGRAEQNEAAAAFTLTRREWAELGDRLRAARFRTLEARYAPAVTIPDSTYDIVRHRGHTVTVHTGGEPPRRLQRLLRYLRRLHDRYGPAR